MKTILIVEDSETCAETLQIALESMPGMKTMVLQDLGSALAALRDKDNNIAALVTDLHMPHPNVFEAHGPRRAAPSAEEPPVQPSAAAGTRASYVEAGFELIRQLRAEARYTKLPVLLISGDSDPKLPQCALDLGADAFFSKPYSPAAVRRKLEQLLC